MLFAFQHSPAGVASTLTSLSPVFVLPLVMLTLGQRVSGRGVAGRDDCGGRRLLDVPCLEPIREPWLSSLKVLELLACSDHSIGLSDRFFMRRKRMHMTRHANCLVAVSAIRHRSVVRGRTDAAHGRGGLDRLV